MDINNLNLRVYLEKHIAKNLDLTKHKSLLEKIVNHQISLIKEFETTEDFNCVMYALNIYLDNPTTLLGRYYVNTNFLRYLIDNSYIKKIKDSERYKGVYVIYFNDAKLTHIGVLEEHDFVISKWGAGHLYKHKIEEVPKSYGLKVEFFESINPDTALLHLKNFYS